MPIFKGKTLGTFGKRGGILNIDKTQIDDASVGLMELSGYLTETAPMMEAFKAIAAADVKDRFVHDRDPQGLPWHPLDRDYADYKESQGKDPDNILTWDGRLERAASSKKAFKVVPSPAGFALIFDTDAIPYYGLFHDAGSGVENVGKAADERFIRRAAWEVGERTVRARHRVEPGIGKGNALPQRQFIGTSVEAMTQMQAVARMWLVHGVEQFYYRSKFGHIQLRSKTGQFGPKVFPHF